MLNPVRVGSAGWAIRHAHRECFPGEGSHLERYAARFTAVEINSSFYRSHRPATYARWAQAVPEGFRFAVKLPRKITHHGRLEACSALDEFLEGIAELGGRLGPLLAQLPPSLEYDPASAGAFFSSLRRRFSGWLVCEPRHPSWFAPGPQSLLRDLHVARAAVDPPPAPGASEPGGWSGLAYYRLHGSPRAYYSAYSPEFLEDLADQLQAISQTRKAWCIFDNTAAGAAIPNALTLLDLLRERNTGVESASNPASWHVQLAHG